MEEDLNKISNINILMEINKVEDTIWYNIIRYNKLAKEIKTRFPQLKSNEEFKPKVLCKKCERR